MEPDAGTSKAVGSAVRWRFADAEPGPNRADNGRAEPVRPHRRQERFLLVPEPQGPGAAEAEARRCLPSQSE